MKKYKEYIERLKEAYIEASDRDSAIIRMHEIVILAADDKEICFAHFKKIFEAMKELEFCEEEKDDQ